MSRFPSRSYLTLALALLIGLTAVGCGGGTGNISGEVKVKDKPLPDGLITFFSQEGKKKVVLGPIKDGKYKVEGVPVGKAIITVQTVTKAPAFDIKAKDGGKEPPVKGKDAKKPDPKNAPVTVATKYGDQKTSGLEVTVALGDQTHDLTVEPAEAPTKPKK
ncbi:MAG: hypothetical protein U0840_24155 [Gemmataceae bacterium]